MRFFNIAFLLLLFLFATESFAQKNVAEAADIAFEEQKYSIAVDKYKKAYSKIKNNREEKNRVRFQMAECYRLMNITKRAESYYKGLVKNKYYKHKPLILLLYADMLKTNQKYDEAIVQYEEYIKLKPDDARGTDGLKSCTMTKEWVENPTNHQINNVRDINSREADFAPTYTTDQFNSLIFTSNREGSTGKADDEWTGENFTDLFFTRIDKKGEWSTPDLLENEGVINSETNEGNTAMNRKFSVMYFTRCGNEKGKKSGCHIYTSKRSGRSWENAEIVALGGDSTSAIGHPSISDDELTLYFAADFENGYGGKDIWYATRKSKGDEFGKPKNMGAVINSEGDEMFPFIRSDSVFYFASDGHVGMGGLDLFRASKGNDSWKIPVNMGSPMNSHADDFAIIFNPNSHEEGFFTSNRKEEGKGGDDIWYFIEPPVEFTLSGTIKDDRTLQYIHDAEIKLIGSDGTSIIGRSNTIGRYEFNKAQILPNTTYELIVSKENYFNAKGTETTVGIERSKDFVRDFVLEPIPKEPIVLPEILYDLAKWDLKPQYQDSLQGLIQTLDQNETIVVELASHTDARDTDERNDILSQKRAQSVVDYLILRGIDPDRLVAKGYGERSTLTVDRDHYLNDVIILPKGSKLTEDFINSLSTTEIKEYAHQLNRRTEFSVLRTNFVPKPTIADVEAPTIDIVIDPEAETNKIKYKSSDENRMTIPCDVNDLNFEITVDTKASRPHISLKKALTLLKDGAISKTDFEGDPNEILAEASIADKAVFIVKKIKILKKEIENIEVLVDHTAEEMFFIDKKTFEQFGKYTIDEESKYIIFE